MKAPPQSNPEAPQTTVPGKRVQIPTGFLIAAAVLLLAYGRPLYQLIRFSMANELYSHIVLIPLISLYLIWQDRAKLPPVAEPVRRVSVLLGSAGVVMLALLSLGLRSGNFPPENYLALTTLSLLFFLGALCAWFLGRPLCRAVLFPLAFLLFMVPLPAEFLASIETLLQHGSAFVARGFFAIAGTTVYVAGLTFQLPGITIEVAPECSGIHSSMALLITSVLAGYFFLRSSTRRTVLALAVIPLALFRNGLRVFVIGELCVVIGPEMIDSYIHRQGGPIFFVFSLIPFFLLLFWLARNERRKLDPK